MMKLFNEPNEQLSLVEQPEFLPSASSSETQYLDFDELVEGLNQKGSKFFSKEFCIEPKDYQTVYKLMVYLYRDQEHARKLDLDLRKGVLLTGPVGCGKTSLMSLMQQLNTPAKAYQLISVRDIAMQFMERGYPVVKHYASIGQKHAQVFCFDDLGCEPSTHYYGNRTNVMAEILLSRYDLFVNKGVPTHVTTNLSAGELEKLYGTRVRSRLREMFNLIAFPADSSDKRR